MFNTSSALLHKLCTVLSDAGSNSSQLVPISFNLEAVNHYVSNTRKFHFKRPQIPGTKRLQRLEENAAAFSIQLTPQQVQELSDAFPLDAAAGGR